MLEAKLRVDKIVEMMEEKKAIDIKVYDMKAKTPFYDYSVICTGSSKRNVDAIVTELKKNMDIVNSVEGLDECEWALIDGGDIIVSVFSKEAREYYDLDGLYGEI